MLSQQRKGKKTCGMGEMMECLLFFKTVLFLFPLWGRLIRKPLILKGLEWRLYAIGICRCCCWNRFLICWIWLEKELLVGWFCGCFVRLFLSVFVGDCMFWVVVIDILTVQDGFEFENGVARFECVFLATWEKVVFWFAFCFGGLNMIWVWYQFGGSEVMGIYRL